MLSLANTTARSFTCVQYRLTSHYNQQNSEQRAVAASHIDVHWLVLERPRVLSCGSIHESCHGGAYVSCRLESMAGLGACTSLLELYLSHNGIWVLDAQLTQLRNLKVGCKGKGWLAVRCSYSKEHCR